MVIRVVRRVIPCEKVEWGQFVTGYSEKEKVVVARLFLPQIRALFLVFLFFPFYFGVSGVL